MGLFQGKTAIVTGSSGIAAATARRLAERGAAVCVVGIDAEEVTALIASDDARAITGQMIAIDAGWSLVDAT